MCSSIVEKIEKGDINW